MSRSITLRDRDPRHERAQRDSMKADEKNVVLAVDLGGTHLRAALIDRAGQILTQAQKRNTGRGFIRSGHTRAGGG